MKKLLVFGCWLLASFSLKAHPGIGIVKDSKGNIFYTDLKQVWKIAPDGNKSVAVKSVHTHELFIDEQDNLFGEHLWYNGEAKNTWGHFVWCLKNNGELLKEIDSAVGFLTNYSFVRDADDNMYWVERFTTSKIMKKTKAGEITKVIEGKFGFIGWLFSTKNGTLYFTENNKLNKVSPKGDLEIIAKNIGSRTTEFTVMGRNYDSYGIWTDTKDNVYLAMIDAKKVLRIDKEGNLQTILSSNSLWTITGGVFDEAGNLWVLENSSANDVRARKIDHQDLTISAGGGNNTSSQHLLITIFTAVAVIILFFKIKKMLNKRKIRFSF